MENLNECLKNEGLFADFKKVADEPDYGKVGNDILYDMCARYPRHIDESEVLARVWLIGRSYAVSIERNGTEKMVLKTKVSDDFFVGVAKIFIQGNFDVFLYKLKGIKSLNRKNIPIILKVHKEAMKFIHENITGDDRRSFVSKYLHFHFRNLFFIYDLRADEAIKDIFSKCEHSKKYFRDFSKDILGNLDNKYDEAYANFFIRCFALSEFLRKKCRFPRSPREIDNYLVKRTNRKK